MTTLGINGHRNAFESWSRSGDTCLSLAHFTVYTAISVELITPNVIGLTPPPHLEIAVRGN